MPYPKKWDWEQVRMEYLVGEVVVNKQGLETHRPFTVKRLAEKHGIPLATLHDKAYKDKWTQQRTLLDSKLRRRMSEGKVTSILGEASMSDNLALAQLSKTSQLINAYFNQYPQAFRSAEPHDGQIANEGYGEEMPSISPRDLKDIVEVIGKIHTLTKAIMETESLQEHLSEIQTKERAKQLTILKNNPKAMNDKLELLMKEKERLERNTRAVEDYNTFNTKAIVDIES